MNTGLTAYAMSEPTTEMPIMMTAIVGTMPPIKSISQFDKKATGMVNPSPDGIGTMKNRIPINDGMMNFM